MKYLLVVSVFIYSWLEITAFLDQTQPSHTAVTTPSSSLHHASEALTTKSSHPAGIGGNITSKCDDRLLNCTADVLHLFNYTNGVADIDSDAVFNFSCRGGIDKVLQCIKTNVKPYCKNDSSEWSAVHQVLDKVLPYANQSKQACDIPEYKEISNCMLKFATLKGFQDCVTGETLNKTLDPADVCGTMQKSMDCSYKYVDLICPEYLQALVDSFPKQGGCNFTIGLGAEATSCDVDMQTVCGNSNKTVTNAIEYACSKEGMAARNCTKKAYNMCKQTGGDPPLIVFDVLPSNELLQRMCSDGGYKEFAACFTQLAIDPDYNQCVTNISFSAICPILQITYDCTADGVYTHCSPAANAFFHQYAPYLYSSYGNCSISFSRTYTSIDSATKPETTTSPPAAAKPETAPAVDYVQVLQKSYLLQMLSHMQHQAQSLATYAKDLDNEAELIYSMISNSSVINRR